MSTAAERKAAKESRREKNRLEFRKTAKFKPATGDENSGWWWNGSAASGTVARTPKENLAWLAEQRAKRRKFADMTDDEVADARAKRAAKAVKREKLLSIYTDIAEDANSPPAARIAAVSAYFDRTEGKPVQTTILQNGGDVKVLSDEELLRIAQE